MAFLLAREDADKERFWSKVVNTKKPIGLLLMDQSCIAGVGNIYRCAATRDGLTAPHVARLLPCRGCAREKA